MNKIWFKKRWQLEWYPVSWEGYVVCIVYMVLFFCSILTIDHEWLKNLTFMILITCLLIFICYKKGEKTKWQWGEREEYINN